MRGTKNIPARGAAALIAALMLTAQAYALEVPVSQTEQMVDGRQTLVKVFEVSPDTDPETLIETDLCQNGYVYTMTSIVKDTVKDESSRNVTQEQVIDIAQSDEDDARIEALKTMPAFIEYEEDGYAGKLYPIVSTLELTETGRTGHSGSTKITRTYTYDYNDDSLIPEAVTDSGKSYSKASVTWSEGAYMADSAIPENYVATVTYTRPYSYTTIDGFTASMTYSGTVDKVDDQLIRYTLTYYGTPEAEFKKAQAIENGEGTGVSTAAVVGGVGGAAALAAAGAGVYLYNKKKSEA